ncbi:MAG: DNA topoisomerase VI, partial [Desulfurococcales archaeon]|nr:DNA topoisomerase VI [Desulfurococcales archaeon]
MALTYVSSKDVKAREKALKILRRKFGEIAEQILKGSPPVMVIRKRTLANTIFDREKGILRIGNESLRRSLLNAGEAKKFMQTVLMASIIYDTLVNNEYPTIRDLYYRGKHTIRYRKLP